MYREALSEGLGTFFLVLIGCGAIIVSRLHPESMTHLGVAMCFGLAVLAMIYTFGDVSGAHLNPAVTLGFLCKGITAGIAVGSVIMMEALFGGPISGASMNPARSFAPAIVGGQFMDLWIYFIGPISGSLFASLIHSNVMRQSEVNFRDTTQVPVDSTP